MGLMHRWGMQLRKPEGLLGKLAGPFMKVSTRQLYDWTIDLLHIQPTDHVLELGFGPGLGIQKVAEITSQGWVAGIDFSKLMVRQAKKRNASAIAAGRVDLKYGDVTSIPYYNETFNKVIAIQLIYFCQPPQVFLEESRRVLKPGGKIAVALIAKEDMEKYKFAQTGVFTLYTGQDVLQLLTEAGFTQAHFEIKPVRPGVGICAIAEK